MFDEFESRIRLQIDVDEDLKNRWDKAIWRGMRSKVLRAIIEQLLDAVEKEGIIVATLVAEGKIRIFG